MRISDWSSDVCSSDLHFSLTPEWSDECYVNHSFAPSALWHLGFIFALRDLAPGDEVTMDYRYVIGDGERMPFADSVTGREIVGLPWPDALRGSSSQLQIGRAHVCTPGTNAHLVCRLLPEKKKNPT